MKKISAELIFLFFLLALFVHPLSAQSLNSLSIGYLGQAAIQPGVKLGADFHLLELANSNEKRSFELFISPQLGFYTNPNSNQNFLANAEVGICRSKRGKAGYSSLGLGLGYLGSNEMLGGSLSLETGAFQTQSEWRNFFLPTINYAFGGPINSQLGWYNKYGVGMKLNPNHERAMMLFVELGLRFGFRNK